jgi:hypothetical protein
MTRYWITCPACGAHFRLDQSSSRGIATFKCPACEEALEYESTGMDYLLVAVSLFAGPLISYYLGYRDLTFFFVSVGAGLLFFLLGIGIIFYVRPPNVQRKLSDGETGLNLMGKSVSRKGHPPAKN